MKMNDYFTCLFINLKNQKLKRIAIVFFLSILFLVSNILIQTSTNISKIFSDYLKYYSEGRTLVVYKKGKYSDIISDLSNYNHIILAYNYEFNYASSNLNLQSNIKNLEIYLKPLNNKYSPKIISGRLPQKKGEIICPKYIEKKSSEIKKIDDLVKMNSYINKDIQLNYSKMIYKNLYEVDVAKMYNKKVKLVGLYDDGYSSGMFNECYMLEDDTKEIVQDSWPIYSNEYLSNVVVEENALSTFVLVDKIENLDSVSNELVNNGYTVDKKFLVNNNLLKNIVTISKILFAIMLFLSSFIFYLYLKNLMKAKKNKIGLYKCFGYSNKQISIIILLEILLIFIIAMLLSRLLLQFIIFLANNQIDKILDFAYIDLKVYFVPQILFIVLSTIILIILSITAIRKVYKLEVSMILNENNL